MDDSKTKESDGARIKTDQFVPFIINKRPKDDEAVSPKPPEQQRVNITVNKPNVTWFKNMESPSVERIISVLDYYNVLMAALESDEMVPKLREEFINFCDEHYDEQMMLQDYMHCIEHHGDRESIAKMASALKYKCTVGSKRCGGMRRHFRDRATSSEPTHFYVDTMDTMHFNVLHLEDVGLRVNLNVNAQSVQNEDNLVDKEILKLSQIVCFKRDEYFINRLNDTEQNGKFFLCSDLGKDVQTEEGLTALDRMNEGVIKRAKRQQNDQENPENHLRNFQKFQDDQQYDTEALNEDMKVFGEEGKSNVAESLKTNEKLFFFIRKMLRYLRISGSSFSTGKWFMYWDWYRTEKGRKEVMQCGYFWKDIDFGGHSVDDLCVYPHFKNLEEEVLSSGLITKENWLKILQKAERFMKTSRCKKMKSDFNGDGFHYVVPKYSIISVHHLCALLLYTDSSAFCTAMSETFRAIFGGETIEEINKRNSRFYWTSRYLRELIMCFGIQSYEEKAPFWTGISFPLHVPQFQIGLIGPTSTSMAKEVALRFAGEQGMLLKLKGSMSKCLNASLFSCYRRRKREYFVGALIDRKS